MFIVESVLKYLAKRDKDTFVFGMIVTLTIIGLIAGAPPDDTLIAGFGFVGCYIIMRFALVAIQLREKQQRIKTLPSRKTESIITRSTSPEEKNALLRIRGSYLSEEDGEET